MSRIVSIFSTILLLSVVTISAQQGDVNSSKQSIEKFNQFYNILNQTYIEEVDMQPLIERAISSMLDELDPHSAYITAEEMKGVEESFSGEFSGIGIEFNVIGDTLMVVNTIVGAPAQSVGVMPNDRIIGIDGESAIGITMSEVPKKLKGVRGTKVDIEVLRAGVDETINFLIIRDNIPLHTVDAAYMVNDSTLYIRVNRFGQTTMREFMEAYNQHQGVGSLILDLRGNGGGLLSEAIDMASFFLPRGSVVVYTEGRNYPKTAIRSDRNGLFLSGDVVVIIDESSASASEIVSGAIQDWDRGVVVGQQSFGKGLIQRQYPLPDASAVRVTVAQYLTPSGRAIQRPYDKGESDEYYKAHYQRFSSHNDSLPSEDNRAIFKTLVKGRDVYGGGGITPDIVVERDTTRTSALYVSMLRRGLISEFILKYLDKNRAKYTNLYPIFEQFDAAFSVSEEMLDELYALSQEHSLTDSVSSDDKWREISMVTLKAMLAQRLFSTSEFYEVVNQSDSTYIKAVESLLK
ncbi:MAG: S41 family peptidase [Rikenellaceae bacterium]